MLKSSSYSIANTCQQSNPSGSSEKLTYSIRTPLSQAPQFPCRIHGTVPLGHTSNNPCGRALLPPGIYSGTISMYWYEICFISSAIHTRCANGQYAFPYRIRSVRWEWSFAVRAAEPDAVPEAMELRESFPVEVVGEGFPEVELVAFWDFLASLAVLSK